MAAIDKKRLARARWPTALSRYLALPALRPRHVTVRSLNTDRSFDKLVDSSGTCHGLFLPLCMAEHIDPVVTLFAYQCQLKTLDELRKLPATLTWLQLADNAYTELANLDFSGLTHFEGWGNKHLTRIENVTFSRRLVMLDMNNVHLQSWIMTTDTYKAVNALKPSFVGDDNERDSKHGILGYTYSNLTIDSNATECTAMHGTIQELWGNNKTARAKLYNQATFRVCVLSNAPTDTTVNSTVISNAPTESLTNSSSATAGSMDSGGMSLGGLVGIAVGCAVVVGFVVFAIMRRRQTRSEKCDPASDNYRSTTEDVVPSEEEAGVDMKQLFLCRISESSLVLHRKLGSGAFVDVWSGTFRSECVAVKKLHSNRVTLHQLESFVDEITLMASFDSPYIVKLIGAAWTRPSDIKCVMELMDGGDLKQHLDHMTAEIFPWSEKYIHIQNIAEGLVYLHSLSIIHRDLKSRNVLLDSKKGTKLTDFGVSKEDLHATMTIGVGTFRWMAPEVIQEQSYSVAADIYSFGVILSELDTHRLPYEDLKHPKSGLPVGDSAILLNVARGEIKPSFTRECPTWIFDTAMQCLAHKPSDRPTALQLSTIIRAKLKELSRRR
ncbi:hypothetical protein Ae201684_005296 [Aphanomyces euteiches]|uniref:Protein kinase domain-containing protein n=1 Tax=Aphanomyces euteiches TaxID=100861 RepID=A0A6G0XFX1_9STRA|nr:hypothetical protein Ae201684_005296 [Aphanomyces euteiches]